MPLKVLIVDDHRLMLEALRLVLGQDPDLKIVAEAESGAAALRLLGRTDVDVVLLDIRMPVMDGLACLEAIRERFPNVKVIALSGQEEPALIRTVLQLGASSFVAKHIDPRDLASAIRQAYQGTVVSPMVGEVSAAAENDSGLSERELGVLKAVGAGLSNKQIARELWLAEPTVKFHLTNIYRKLGVRSRTEAAHHAYRHGLVEHPMLRAAAVAR
jgi:DNA-binding NarL/FixJ family response regulator